MLATFISISRISTARRPSGFEIRCKKRFDLLKQGFVIPTKEKEADCKSAK